MADLWIIRHGETEWSKAGRHTGRTDLRLTPRGEAQAVELKGRLGKPDFVQVRTSPLQRARQTCELSGCGERVVPDPRLLEWDYGVYEGKTSAEIQTQIPGWNIWDNGVIGGETIDQVAARTDSLIEELDAITGNAALFAHGHVLRVLTARWLRQSPTYGRYLLLEPTSFCILAHEHGQPVVKIWNGG